MRGGIPIFNTKLFWTLAFYFNLPRTSKYINSNEVTCGNLGGNWSNNILWAHEHL